MLRTRPPRRIEKGQSDYAEARQDETAAYFVTYAAHRIARGIDVHITTWLVTKTIPLCRDGPARAQLKSTYR